MAAGPLDRLRLTDARLAGHGQRAAHGRRARRPGRRGARRLEAAQRPPDHAHPGAARRDRDHLREPAQRHERRRRAVRQGRQRGAAARQLDRAAVEHRGRVGAARRARQARAARRRRDPRRRHRVRDRHRGDAAHRLRRLPDPARRAVADQEHPRQRDGPGDHRRRRQLPRLRRRVGRPRRGR